jgi:hypothetical protein
LCHLLLPRFHGCIARVQNQFNLGGMFIFPLCDKVLFRLCCGCKLLFRRRNICFGLCFGFRNICALRFVRSVARPNPVLLIYIRNSGKRAALRFYGIPAGGGGSCGDDE